MWIIWSALTIPPKLVLSTHLFCSKNSKIATGSSPQSTHTKATHSSYWRNAATQQLSSSAAIPFFLLCTGKQPKLWKTLHTHVCSIYCRTAWQILELNWHLPIVWKIPKWASNDESKCKSYLHNAHFKVFKITKPDVWHHNSITYMEIQHIRCRLEIEKTEATFPEAWFNGEN